MANYNTFLIVECKSRKIELVTSSARKALNNFDKGKRIEVWNKNNCLEKIYLRDFKKEINPLKPYIDIEKDYIRKKQEMAEIRNKRKIQ